MYTKNPNEHTERQMLAGKQGTSLKQKVKNNEIKNFPCTLTTHRA